MEMQRRTSSGQLFCTAAAAAGVSGHPKFCSICLPPLPYQYSFQSFSRRVSSSM